MSMNPVPGDRRAAWRIVRAFHMEIARQAREGRVSQHADVDQDGHCLVNGILDLAMLAYVAELALRREFGL